MLSNMFSTKWGDKKNEECYFIDRNPDTFEIILECYRNFGKTYKKTNITKSIIMDEIDYFCIEKYITYNEYDDIISYNKEKEFKNNNDYILSNRNYKIFFDKNMGFIIRIYERIKEDDLNKFYYVNYYFNNIDDIIILIGKSNNYTFFLDGKEVITNNIEDNQKIKQYLLKLKYK